MTTLLGTTLNGRYRLEARIGAGGMSTVYRATDETLQRQVAIKLMHREIATDSDQLERFRREARAVAQLSHPHIVGVIDYGEDGGRPYIVFEYVEGETLKERIRRNGRLPITEAVAYAIEVARALGTAHARHIVHRDVKPQNVLIDEEGSAKVTDFGIARTLDEEGLTADGRVLGTTDYVSPEQALGRPVTGQSDLYSLGIVLYEMVTGEVPFKGENQVAVAMKHVREHLPDVQYKRPEVSAALAAVLDTATAKRVEDRYADDAELIADLEDVLAIETARAGSATGEVTSVLRTLPSQTRRRVPFRVRHPARALGLTLVLLAIAGGAVAWLVATRTHHEVPKLAAPAPAAHLTQVRPCPSCARDYNPDAISGPKTQSPQLDGLAIDGNVNTPWVTEHYYSGSLQKDGVGLYVDLDHPVAVREMVVYTQTPGFRAQIWASNSPPDPDVFKAGPGGWTKLADLPSVQHKQLISLGTGGAGGTRYRYYLVWIKTLPPRQMLAMLNEIVLYRLTR
ncbi:MAG: serine/threonine protein kinase [Solirubrobacterales bacterium]|nr:serine/threonine protein kinase [Solirubrobacterales bacterium]MBV9363005.1 serine/threonine protein kinase [Solirubrobacterales bacterium]